MSVNSRPSDRLLELMSTDSILTQIHTRGSGSDSSLDDNVHNWWTGSASSSSLTSGQQHACRPERATVILAVNSQGEYSGGSYRASLVKL